MLLSQLASCTPVEQAQARAAQASLPKNILREPRGVAGCCALVEKLPSNTPPTPAQGDAAGLEKAENHKPLRLEKQKRDYPEKLHKLPDKLLMLPVQGVFTALLG